MSEPFEAIDAILDRGGEADDVLREVVDTLAAAPGIEWVGVAFLEQGSLVLGPEVGTPNEALRVRLPVVYEGSRVGELWVDGEADRSVLDRVAALVSAYVLIGWDTRGEVWEP